MSEDRGVPFLAMELLEGESLAARLEREGKLPVAEVLRIGREIALGLAAAHRRDLIHRDIKPANIWLEVESGQVKILDFGLARATSEGPQLTQQGAILGTPAYMAPEQAQGKPLDGRCDLFSLGCVLYRMATGQPAFCGSDIVSTLMAVATEEPPAPRQLDVNAPAALSELIMSLLAKAADDRPPSAHAVADALQEMAQATPSGPAEKIGPALGRRRLALAIVLLLGLGGLLLAGVVLRLRVRTVEGPAMVVLEIDNPGAEVFIDGNKMNVTVPGDNKPLEIRVEPGRHQLRISKDSFVAYTRDIELTTGTVGPVRIRLEPLPRTTPATVPAATRLPPGLAEEEWLQRVKGLYFGRVPDAVAERLRELNPGFDAKVEYELDGKDVVKLSFLTTTVKDLTPLRALPGLRNLACGGKWPVLGQIRDLKPLEGIKLTSLDIRDTQVANLSPLKGMPLTDLVCAGTKVADLSPLQGMPLKNLRIDSTPVGDLSPLKGMKLESLNCFANQVTDLAPLKDMKLRYLDCNAQVTDAGLTPLQEMSSLRDLRIGGPKMTEAGLAHLKNLTGLERLDILNVPLTEAGLRNLKGMTRLECLLLPNTALTDNALIHLKGFRRLRILSLVQTRVTDAGLEHLAGLENLVELNVARTAVTDKGAAKLKAALLGCQIIR